MKVVEWGRKTNSFFRSILAIRTCALGPAVAFSFPLGRSSPRSAPLTSVCRVRCWCSGCRPPRGPHRAHPARSLGNGPGASAGGKGLRHPKLAWAGLPICPGRLRPGLRIPYYLKIDGDFIRGLATSPMNQLVVSAIVSIARGMGKKTVAEFVADAEATRLRRKIGVDFAQGDYIGVAESRIGGAADDGSRSRLTAFVGGCRGHLHHFGGRSRKPRSSLSRPQP